jgi:hypothetical protein
MVAVPDGEKRVAMLRRFFIKHQSPLADAAEAFILASHKYNIPEWILVGISNAESTLGKRIAENSYNPFGYKCYDGQPCYNFKSWDEAVYSLAATLRFEHYYADYRKTGKIEDIAKRYLTGNKQRWIGNVTKYRDELVMKP